MQEVTTTSSFESLGGRPEASDDQAPAFKGAEQAQERVIADSNNVSVGDVTLSVRNLSFAYPDIGAYAAKGCVGVTGFNVILHEGGMIVLCRWTP